MCVYVASMRAYFMVHHIQFNSIAIAIAIEWNIVCEQHNTTYAYYKNMFVKRFF